MQTPEVLTSEDVYHGLIFDVAVDTVREGDLVYRREVVRHPGSAAIVAVFTDRTVAVVRQYRHPAARYLLEIPAGSRATEAEPPEDCAARELEEELGFTAAKLEKITEFFVSPGFCSEKMWIYLATNLTETKQRLEEDEQLEVVRVHLEQALRMVAAGEIEDAKTIIGLTLASKHISSPSPGVRDSRV